MSKLSFRARALDASKPMPIYLAEELPDLPDYSAINRAVPQMPSGMEKEEESEHHLQRAISGTGLIIPTPEVCQVTDLEFYERCYPPDYKIPKQHIHMQPLWEEQETPEYDIDTEDERWLKQQRHPELTDLKFEQMMDKLERSSGQTVVTLNEAKLLLERHDDLVIAVYDYWLNKRLNTQHALILSVKTENRPGQSSNNPYLAFRRRTEKMQTRKNRKNDESSYEKMLKLRRDLARALSLLEMVARRERAKRELVRLTALIAERRYAAGDFANHLLPEPPPRPVYQPVPFTPCNFRRETYSIPHYPPRPPPTQVDQPRQREKRSYKKRKHRLPAAGSLHGLRDSGVYTSSEEESSVRVEHQLPSPAPPPDDGPFAFKRKPGCFYEMPTSTLCGDPVDADTPPTKDTVYEHELDERHRYTLTSVSSPYSRCVGFARRRRTRGGRVALDRIASPLDDLWPTLPFRYPHSSQELAHRREEVDLETKAHRTPKEISRDYYSCCKYPWRRAFRKHLAQKPELWTCPTETSDDPKLSIDVLKPTIDELKPSIDDLKPSIDEFKPLIDELKPRIDDVAPSLDDIKLEPMDYSDIVVDGEEKSDISDSVRTSLLIDDYVRGNLDRVMRKRALSVSTDSSYDSDESLHPVEVEFENFINEVNNKWLHFRPKTPSPSPALTQSDDPDEHFPINDDTPITVELRETAIPFITKEFTLGQFNTAHDHDTNGVDIIGDHLTGVTEVQMETMLSETDLIDTKDKKKSGDMLEKLVNNVDGKDSFLLHGQSPEGRAGSGSRKRKAESFGSSRVTVTAVDNDPIYIEVKSEPPPPPPLVHTATPTHTVTSTHTAPKHNKEVKPVESALPAPVPTANIILEEVNEVPPIKVEKRKKEEIVVEGVSVRVPTVRHSPVKKQSTFGRRTADVIASIAAPAPTPASAPPADSQPQILTVAVSDTLKVRLQNHLLSTQAGVLVQNGPFQPVVAVPVHSSRDGGVPVVTSVAGSSGSQRRVPGPLVHLAPASLAHKHLQLHHHQGATHTAHPPLVVTPPHTIHHVAPNKLKVLHAHSLTHQQRAQLLAQNRVAHLPTVVSLATLADSKSTNTAILKAAPGSVAQLFEIKSGHLGKGPHLVNVVRQPQPGKTTVTRLDINDKKRQVVTAYDGQLKGNMSTAPRPHRVSVSLDGRQLVRAALPASVRPPHIRHQIQLKNRTLQVTAPTIPRAGTEPSTSITITAPGKTASIPSSVVANLLQKNVQLPKGGQKIAISGPGGQALSANVQAIAFTTAAQLKARQARLITQSRPAPTAEIVESSSVTAGTSAGGGGGMVAETVLESATDGDDAATNGGVRRRTGDSLPMEVT